jgi:acyl-coenzyme A synthetase/AMP-(fatty) acid ligase
MSELFNFSSFFDNYAIISDKGESMTYKSLDNHCNELALYLEKGKFVFCFCDNVMGSLIGYVTFIREGIPVVMIDGSKDLEMLNNLSDVFKPNYIWLPKHRLQEFGNYEVIYDMFDYVLITFHREHHKLYKGLALMLPTSGSTGSPKLVKLTRKNVHSNAESIAEYLNITTKDKPITSLPMHYSFGLSVINSHLLVGATILLTDKSIAQKEFWVFAKGQKASSLSGVPYTYEMLKRFRFFRMELPHMKTLTQAGGKLSADLVKDYVEFATQSGRKFIVMYGQTEATARMSYLPFDKAVEKYKSVGIAIPGGQFSLIDVNGKEIVEPDVDGELIYTGDNVSLGYAESLSDLKIGDENDGVLRTGDIAKRDTDGYYYITGRLKRFIKIYGNRVNLDHSEQIVKTVTPDCACVGRDDKMIVYITDDCFSEEVRSLLSKTTGLNNQAFDIRSISEIPKNGSGKIQYTRLSNV